MDCVIPTHDRPERLACTLVSLLQQSWDGPRRLFLVDNSRHDVCSAGPVRKALLALERTGWEVRHQRSAAASCTEIKLEALRCGRSPHLVLIDNDVLFTRGDTIAALDRALTAYDVGAASPVAYDIDGERAVLTPYVAAYDRHPPDACGVLEGTVALGACLAFVRADVEEVLAFWRWRLSYMEDQVLVHFLKARRGYAFLRHHTVLHWGESEAPSYEFDDLQVVRHLEDLAAEDPRFGPLLELRRELRDGADFPKAVSRR
ncbi:MAG TPA: glycosyltransferase family A protein [Thermoanaerobaculia bacterium]|nr:glycosyltransferase family A protein [Thermoanaerobaculia bacterium]